MAGGVMADRLQSVLEHQCPLQFRFDAGVAQPGGRHRLCHIVMAEGVQHKVAEEAVHIGPVCHAVRMGLQHPGCPFKELPARPVVKTMPQLVHRIFGEGLIVKEEIRPVQADGIELGEPG